MRLACASENCDATRGKGRKEIERASERELQKECLAYVLCPMPHSWDGRNYVVAIGFTYASRN